MGNMDSEKIQPKSSNDIAELKELMRENNQLVKDNNTFLRKMHRNTIWGMWIRIVWYAILLGLPFLLYFYIFEPYFDAFGSDYEKFRDGINELPGLKGINDLFYGGEATTEQLQRVQLQ